MGARSGSRRDSQPAARAVGAALWVEDPRVRALMPRIVLRVAGDPSLQDDLVQEGMIHLWQSELRCPGQTVSWYLQSCRYHLRNYMNRGRSLDAHKRRATRCDDASDWEGSRTAVSAEAGFFSPLHAREMTELLSRISKPSQRILLGYLADGFRVREIARLLCISHQSVSKQREAIAGLARQLGFAPLTPPTIRGA